MKSSIISILIILCIVIGAITAEKNPHWKQIDKTKDGITVYSRKMPDSYLKEVKAEGIIDAAPADVYIGIKTGDAFKKIKTYIDEKRIIDKGKSYVYVYERVSVPFISKRDFTLHYKFSYNSKNQAYTVKWTTANEKGPPLQRKVIRVDLCKGAWTILPHSNGTKTYLKYWIITDPKGFLPKWLVNYGLKKSVPNGFRAVREYVMKREKQ